MILHTIINPDDIFYTPIEIGFYHKQDNRYIETVYSGKNAVIRSMFSTNPYDYLSGQYAPNSKYNDNFRRNYERLY